MDHKETPTETIQQKLCHAVWADDAAGIRSAIAQGADPNGFYTASMTMLQFATFHGKAEAADALLAGGASVPTDALAEMGGWKINDYMIDGEEDAYCYYRVAKALLDRGADPDVKADEGKSLAEYYDWSPSLHRLFTDAIAKQSGSSSHPTT